MLCRKAENGSCEPEGTNAAMCTKRTEAPKAEIGIIEVGPQLRLKLVRLARALSIEQMLKDEH